MALGAFAAIAGLTQLVNPLVGLLSDCYDIDLWRFKDKNINDSNVNNHDITTVNKHEHKDEHERYSYSYHKGMKRYGKRLPYLIFGTILMVCGILGMLYASMPIHTIGTSVSGSTTDTAAPPVSATTSSSLVPKTGLMGGAWIQYTVFYTILMIGINTAYTVMYAFIPDYIPHSQTGAANGTMALMAVLGSLFGFGMFHLVLRECIEEMYRLYGVVAFGSGVVTFLGVCEREWVKQQQQQQQQKDEQQQQQQQQQNAATVENELHGLDNEKDNGENNQDQDVNKRDQDQGSNDDGNGKSNEKSNDNDNNNGGVLGETDIHIHAKIPPLHEMAYALLYEPIMDKTNTEILSAFWIDISQHRDFFVVTISRFFYYMGISSQTFFLYFIHDAIKVKQQTGAGVATAVATSTSVADPEADVALLAMVAQTAGAITCYPIGIISDQYFGSRRKPFVYLSCICLGVGNLTLVYCTELRQMMWVVALLGAANGIYLTMDTSLAVDTLKTDVDVDGDVGAGADADAGADTDADANIDIDLSFGELLVVDDDISFDDDLPAAAADGLVSNEGLGLHIDPDPDSRNQNQDEKVKVKVKVKVKGDNDNHTDAAQLLGVWGVFGFIGSATGPLIGGISLVLFGRIGNGNGNGNGRDTDTDTDTNDSDDFYSLEGYEILFSLSAFYFLCSAVSLAFVQKKGV